VFAVKVESHPIEYCDFEAVIPEGNYGAGPMVVWDRGRFVPEIDPREGMRGGEIKFSLQGYKLRGDWELIRMKKEKEFVRRQVGMQRRTLQSLRLLLFSTSVIS